LIDELPRITKKELTRVGITLVFEDNIKEWMYRGWREMEMYLWGNEQLRSWLDQNDDKINRTFEEDGA